MSLISAITSKGHMRFMVRETGGVNAEVFIEFLKRLLPPETKRFGARVAEARISRARAVRTARQYSTGVMPVALANRRRKVRLSNPAADAIEASEISRRPSLMCTHC
jgi:hypothetical protein